jgi:serine/threonine protein kinase
MSDTSSSEPEHDSESDTLPAYSVLPQSQPEVSENSWVDTSHEFTYNLEVLKEDLLSKHGLHWDEDLQKAEAKIPANQNNLIPPFYVQVLEVGVGATGDVWLCLPRSFAVAAMHTSGNESPLTFKELEANLVAVKVSQGSYQVSPALNEAKVLQELSKRIETADMETIPRFALPQAHSTADFDDKDRTLYPFWLAMRAVQPALPLGDIFDLHVTDVGNDIFQIIVLHSFCEIMDSLSFLHDFSILHNDVHGYNVLLEPTDDLPAVCLIDFGFSKSNPGESSKEGFKEPD